MSIWSNYENIQRQLTPIKLRIIISVVNGNHYSQVKIARIVFLVVVFAQHQTGRSRTLSRTVCFIEWKETLPMHKHGGILCCTLFHHGKALCWGFPGATTPQKLSSASKCQSLDRLVNWLILCKINRNRWQTY